MKFNKPSTVKCSHFKESANKIYSCLFVLECQDKNWMQCSWCKDCAHKGSERNQANFKVYYCDNFVLIMLK